MKTMKQISQASRWLRAQQALMLVSLLVLAIFCQRVILQGTGGLAQMNAVPESALEASVAVASKLVAYQKTLEGAEINLVPCATSYGVRGACADKHIPAGGLVCKVPRANLWTHDTLRAGDVGKAFVDITKKLGRRDLNKFCPLAAYHLLYERDLGENSRWAHQVHLLASSTNDSALTWTKERMLQEYGMDLYTSAGYYVESILKTQRIVRGMLSSRMPSLLKYSFDDYLWAYSKCSSRAWGNKLTGEPFMAPGANDILNSGKRGMVLSHVNNKGDFVFTAGVNVERGEELQYYYEEAKDTDQLLAYGYLPRKV